MCCRSFQWREQCTIGSVPHSFTIPCHSHWRNLQWRFLISLSRRVCTAVSCTGVLVWRSTLVCPVFRLFPAFAPVSHVHCWMCSFDFIDLMLCCCSQRRRLLQHRCYFVKCMLCCGLWQTVVVVPAYRPKLMCRTLVTAHQVVLYEVACQAACMYDNI